LIFSIRDAQRIENRPTFCHDCRLKGISMATAIGLKATVITLLGVIPISWALDSRIREPWPSGPPVPASVSAKRALDAACAVTSADLAQANSLALGGHFAESLAKLESALNALEQASKPDPVNRACLMNMIGFLEQQQRRPALAVEWFRRALNLQPESDPLLALLTGNLASAYAELSQFDRAEEAARQAIQLSVHAFGSNDPETMLPMTTLVFIQVARGEYVAAEPVLRRVLARAEQSWGAFSYEAALAAGNLGFIHFVHRRYGLARELLQKSLAGLEQNPIRARREIPLTQALLAGSYAAEGRRRQADIWLERALTNAEQQLSPEDPALSIVLERAAVARFCLKDSDSGRELFDRAVALLEARHGPGSQPVLDALDRYAALLRFAQDKTGARVLEERRKTFTRK
jgi:tetratricopeptide (TPR) repeat protein